MHYAARYPYYYRSSGEDTPVFDEDYQAVLDYATAEGITLPDDETKQIHSDLRAQSKTNGWATGKIAIYFLFANTEAREFCKINQLNPGTYDLTESQLDALGFSSLGFNGDGTNYLLTGFNPSSAADALFTQNNSSLVAFIATNEASTGVDMGSSDGTRQNRFISRNASDQRSYLVNDGTGTNIAETYGRGFHIIFRDAAATKRYWKDGAQTNTSVNSTGLPNAQVAILARGLSSGVDFVSPRTIGYASIGNAPSSDDIAYERADFAEAYVKAQKPLFFIEDIDGAPTQLVDLGAGGSWDARALICGPVYHNGTILLYGGSNQDNAGDVNEYSIGAFDLTNAYTGTKEGTNPLITPGDVGLGADQGLVPHAIWSDGIYYYLGCTVYQADDTLSIAMMRAPVNDPKNFQDYTLIINPAGTGSAHAPRFFEDDAEPTKLFMTLAYRTESGVPLRTAIASCLKSDLFGTWTIENTDIIASTPAGVTQEYAQIWKDGATWYATYGRFYGIFGASNFSMWTTSSADRTSFTEGKQNLTPSGVPSQFDESYRAHYQVEEYPIPTTNVPMYFGGRQGTGNSNYIGIGVKNIRRRE